MSNHLWLITGPLASQTESQKPSLRQWLARGDVGRVDSKRSAVARLMDAMGNRHFDPDRAAYRYSDHAEPPAGRFIAAADPVYLEPRLDHLCLYASSIDTTDLEQLRDHLNGLLADDGSWSLEVQGGELYFVGDNAVPTSSFPSTAISGLLPNQFMPDGKGAADYRRRLSEFEMALHEHPVNLARVAKDLQPVNSLWLWGGGHYSPPPELELPQLYSNDSHLRGVWRAAGGQLHDMPAQFTVASISQDTVIGPVSDAASTATLKAARAALRSGAVTGLTILSLDGFVIRHRKRDWMRIFRRPHKELI